MSMPTFSSKIYELHFHILGGDETAQDSYVSITNKETFRSGDFPVQDGVYSPNMGTTDYTWNCTTCGNVKGQCPGHPGQITLKYPVKNPLFRDQLLRWLKIVCFKCGNIIIQKNPQVHKSKLLAEFGKLCRGVSKCQYCGADHPNINRDKYEQSAFYIETPIVSSSGTKTSGFHKEDLYNHEILSVLERISDETVQRAGKLPVSHPKKFILEHIKVAPNTIRPDIRKIGGNRSNSNDITALTKNIVEINTILPDAIPDKSRIDKDLREKYYNLDMTYFELVKGSSGTGNQVRMITSSNKQPNSLANRIPKKDGRIRRNLMGKRVAQMARSVITGDNMIRVDELGIPIEVAKAISIPETVSQFNMDRLSIYFMNRRHHYPGCTKITKKSNGKSYNIDHLEANYRLQIGDIVYRDLIDGDTVNFNRQPSLLWSNISAHKLRVLPGAMTFRVNSSACALYNADFDGDKHCVLNSRVPNWVWFHQFGKNIVKTTF
jgi:DNA-directed RNA polymerase beta' subunit